MAAAITGAFVCDILPDVLAGLCFLLHRLGYQPYLLVFMQHPHFLGIGLDMQGMDKAIEFRET